MRKVLFIANAIVGEMPGLTGGEVRFIEIAKNWQKHGYRIHLLSSRGGRILCEKLGLKVILHSISNSKEVNRLTFITRFFEAFFLPKTLEHFDEGIVYSSSEQIYDVIPGVILKLKSLRKIKLAVAVHWLPPVKWWERKQSTFLNSLLFLISERTGLFLGCLFANRLLPVSEATKNQMRKSLFGRLFLKKVTAVECGINFQEIRKISQKVKVKKYEAVFMKRIQAVKGVFDLIKILDIVVKKIPEAKLIVIGSGIDEEEAKRMVFEKKLNKNIEFLGVIYDMKEKFNKLAESRLFLLPSYEENWAIVIGEAMTAGLPVLAYDLPELIEVWKDNFIQVPLGNTKIFADKIIELLDNPKEIDRMSKKALKFVKKYDWEAIAKKELEIISSVR